MADVTPPVGLASYAAAAISKADPIKTGVQAFWYSLRTGILPIVFIFNNELSRESSSFLNLFNFFCNDDLKFWKKAPKNVNIIQFIADY